MARTPGHCPRRGVRWRSQDLLLHFASARRSGATSGAGRQAAFTPHSARVAHSLEPAGSQSEPQSKRKQAGTVRQRIAHLPSRGRRPSVCFANLQRIETRSRNTLEPKRSHQFQRQNQWQFFLEEPSRFRSIEWNFAAFQRKRGRHQEWKVLDTYVE